MTAKEAEAAKLTGFEVLFGKLEDAEQSDLVKLSEEIARLSEPIRALSEATAELSRPRFTTFISS